MANIKTYSEQIIDHIKKMLLDGRLKPGDKVNEVHLATELSISRAPIREALQMLSKDGLIVYIPQRGKFIKALSPEEIKDSYFIGGVLEGAAIAESIKHFAPEDLAKLEGLVEQMRNISKDKDYIAESTKIDVNFHNTLLAYSKSKLIVEHSRSMCQRVSKFLLVRHWPVCFNQDEIVERHQDILNAVRAKDKGAIEHSVRKHYNDLGERMAKFGCIKPPYNAKNL